MSTNDIETTYEIPPEEMRRKVGRRFQGMWEDWKDRGSEMQKSAEMAKGSIDLGEYLAACEYLGRNILTAELLSHKLEEFYRERHSLKQRFAFIRSSDSEQSRPVAYSRCFLAVTPTTETGYDFQKNDIQEHCYFRVLVVTPPDNMTSNLSSRMAPYFDLYPQEIQNCSFEARWDAWNRTNISDRMVTKDEFITFCENFIYAFNNLRSLFGLDEIYLEGLEDFYKRFVL